MEELPSDVLEFIQKHPGKAILMLHQRHKSAKGGDGMVGTGFSFKKFIKSVGSVGSKLTKKAYEGAKKLYDYTNGLPYTAAEKIGKKAFGVDLNKFQSFRDARDAYGWIMGDPRKYKKIYDAVSNPKKTLNNIRKYAPGAVVGGIFGGPSGAASGVVKQRIGEDVGKDLGALWNADFKSGSGIPMPPIVNKFIQKHPDKAREINKIIKRMRGSGMSETKKNILKAAAAIGIPGALAFVGWLQNRQGPITIPQLEHNIHDPLTYDLEWSSGTGMGSGVELAGHGSIDSMLSFIRKHKKKALSILLGTAVAGALVAGESLFRNKFAGTASTSSDGMAILKHLLSGSDKKLETDRLIMHGPNIVKVFGGTGLKPAGGGLKLAGQGEGMDERTKTALKFAGALTIPAAVLFAKWIISRGPVIDDDFGDISAEEHYELFGDGMPNEIKQFIKMYPAKAKKIMKKLTGGSGLTPAGGARRRKTGSKEDVYNGLADKTPGGLIKTDLCMNGRGKVVSKKQSMNGKKRMAHMRSKMNKT